MLYGSYARGDYDGESEMNQLSICLSVVLNDNEIYTITDVFILSDLTLKAILPHSKAVSTLPVSG